MRKFIGLLALGGLLLARPGFADTNVALNKTVTLTGAFDSAPPNGTPASVTDGIFLPEGTNYQTGTISWFGTTPSVNIDLGRDYALTGFQVQVDNNDLYNLQYQDAGGVYQTVYTAPIQTNGGGMATRPLFTLTAPITARFLRLTGTGGDSLYAVSEIQAFIATPAAVPEPGATGLLASGLVTVGGLLLRRRRQARP